MSLSYVKVPSSFGCPFLKRVGKEFKGDANVRLEDSEDQRRTRGGDRRIHIFSRGDSGTGEPISWKHQRDLEAATVAQERDHLKEK